MRELFALTIDRATSAEVSRINKEIGKAINFTGYQRSRFDSSRVSRLDPSYQQLLTEYVKLKLMLHHARRSVYYARDLYTERDDVDIVKTRERCAELREQIKAKRKTISYAAWGDLTPWTSTPYDRPILYAMDEHTCSFVTGEDEDHVYTCPLQGRHWFHGSPYCRPHMREARALLSAERNRKKYETRERRVWDRFAESETVENCLALPEPEFRCPDCQRMQPHWHCLGRVHY